MKKDIYCNSRMTLHIQYKVINEFRFDIRVLYVRHTLRDTKGLSGLLINKEIQTVRSLYVLY